MIRRLAFCPRFSRALAVFVLPVAVSLAGCGGPKAAAPASSVKTVDLLALLPKAALQAPKADHIMLLKLPVAGEERDALYMHPPSRATYPPVRLTLESRLELSFGVSEKAWEAEGDGVQFSVYARPAGGDEVRIFSTYVDPKHEMRDRRWVDALVTLGTYAGQDVALALETDSGPAGNIAWDWAGWSKATLVLGRE